MVPRISLLIYLLFIHKAKICAFTRFGKTNCCIWRARHMSHIIFMHFDWKIFFYKFNFESSPYSKRKVHILKLVDSLWKFHGLFCIFTHHDTHKCTLWINYQKCWRIPHYTYVYIRHQFFDLFFWFLISCMPFTEQKVLHHNKRI